MKYPSAANPNSVRQALVLSGGGARAAYQVGCLRHIAKAIPEYRPKILTGVSAGAINAAQLAAYRGDWSDAVERLCELWLSLETNKVYHADFRHVSRRVLHLGAARTQWRSAGPGRCAVWWTARRCSNFCVPIC